MSAGAGVRVALTVASVAPEHGGPSRTVPGLCDALSAAGARANVLTAAIGRPYGARLRQRLRSADVQILHDNGVWLPVNHDAVSAGRALAIPVVVSPRGMLTPWSLRHHRWKKRLAWWGYQRRDLRAAALLHATSGAEADEVRALGMHQPIAVIPNGVALPTLRSRGEPRAERTVVFLSRVHPKKGLLDLVRAWSIARPSGWRVVIAGPDEGGHAAEVRAAVRAARLESSISLVGAVDGDAKADLLQSADLFVLPTYSENFGVVVAEALASRLPVITTKGTPWSDLETERCGWWIDVGAEPLAEALRRAVELSDAERRAMGARGRDYVARQFSWAHVAREMLAAYQWLLGGGAPPASVRHA